jgi:DNA-binding NarL/FixJ family response regulator
MERKFHAALSERQRKTVQAALTLLEAGSDIEITEQDIKETLAIFSIAPMSAERVQRADEKMTLLGEMVTRVRSMQVAGYSNAEIADALDIDESTVRRIPKTA